MGMVVRDPGCAEQWAMVGVLGVNQSSGVANLEKHHVPTQECFEVIITTQARVGNCFDLLIIIILGPTPHGRPYNFISDSIMTPMFCAGVSRS
jgi:hypothetical protein